MGSRLVCSGLMYADRCRAGALSRRDGRQHPSPTPERIWWVSDFLADFTRRFLFLALRGHAGQPGPRAENRERGLKDPR
jgi:hypothetical protein